MEATQKIEATKRPFLITFHRTGETFRLDSEAAQRIIDAGIPENVAPDHVDVRSRSDSSVVSSIYPATIGGGDAFHVLDA